ncbi:serine O-acetyltransferase [Albimonas pacifica]|uniref:Serine O-acetyltransferase n=1 Tax=Albimonas pacifica TaxID=1114924 RepID=A0A1I3HZF1_9RHOB|nr:serine acetyltransferase [Albimonas pacifica]SFI40969.1 serine O-acetyltransferase [Albimonas pacifica]
MTERAVSAETPDWTRERPRRFWDPARRLLRAIRRWQACGTGPLGRLAKKRWALSHRFWSAVTSVEVPLKTPIAGGLMLPHPTGVVVHPDTVIGPNCILFQNVTLGTNYGRRGAPRLGGHVDVGPGAVVLGPVTIGDHALIAANAVVLSDVPPGAVVAGAPARVIRYRAGAGPETGPTGAP